MKQPGLGLTLTTLQHETTKMVLTLSEKVSTQCKLTPNARRTAFKIDQGETFKTLILLISIKKDFVLASWNTDGPTSRDDEKQNWLEIFHHGIVLY